MIFAAPLEQLASSPDCRSGSRRFEPGRVRHFNCGVEQVEAHQTHTLEVAWFESRPRYHFVRYVQWRRQ